MKNVSAWYEEDDDEMRSDPRSSHSIADETNKAAETRWEKLHKILLEEREMEHR